MKSQVADVHVTLAADGFYPQTLQWRGSIVRVLCVEECRTMGMQRRFRVRTPDGPYELGFRIDTQTWCVRRHPGWLARARARLAGQPRYPLPAGRRRARPQQLAVAETRTASGEGGSHASRLALVRQ